MLTQTRKNNSKFNWYTWYTRYINIIRKGHQTKLLIINDKEHKILYNNFVNKPYYFAQVYNCSTILHYFVKEIQFCTVLKKQTNLIDVM